MLNDILNFADEFDMLPEAGLVLACVSGGADSMCLLEALLEISRQRGFTVGAVHFNHKLRGEESDRDEAFVGEQCSARGTPLYTGGGDVRAYAQEHGLGIEAAAREMRYYFFYTAASNANAVRIATAHTADDNAETMIFNLTRGTGTAGLSGIPPKRGIIIRPMLRVSRDEVMNFISLRGVKFVEDSTNDLEIFTRNKLRRTVIPVLKQINPRLKDAVSSAAEISRADEEFLSGLADDFIREHCGRNGQRTMDDGQWTMDNGQWIMDDGRWTIDDGQWFLAPNISAGELRGLPAALSSRVIRKLCGGNLSYKHVKAVMGLCEGDSPPAAVSLPSMTVYREYGRIVFCQTAPPEGFAAVFPTEGDIVEIPELKLKILCKSDICNENNDYESTSLNDAAVPPANGSGRINKSLTSFLFKSTDIYGKMTVRPRGEGDSIRFPRQNCTKTLKKLFIERRIPARDRALIPIIADDAGVLAVYGMGTGDRAAPQPGDPVLRIDFEEI